jgi:ABC-type sugar transport system ATPase subunit
MPIKVENASKRSGNRWLFRDVSFKVADGELFGIFGPNGSGKQELLASLSGETANNSIVSRLFRKNSAGASERYIETLDRIENATGAVFLHSPFAGLDRQHQETIAVGLRNTAVENDSPVIFTTANFDDVLLAADRAAVIADGYLQQIGTPQQLYREPENQLTASLTGPNNLVEARRLTSSKSEMPEFQTADGEHRLFTQKTDLRGLGAINKNAILSIRPEQIVLSFGASFPEDNLLKGVISEIKFRGPATYVTLDCSGLELEAMVTRLIGLNIGDECMVGLPPDRIRVLAD